MTTYEPGDQEFRPQSPAEFAQEKLHWLREAVELYHGPEVEGDLLDLLPEPNEVRSTDEGWELDREQEEQLRNIAGKVGIGGREDIHSGADDELLEGGMPWKIEAELAIADGTVLLAGSPYREVGEQEKIHVANKYGVQVSNEYEMARVLVERSAGYIANEEDVILPFGYDIQNGQQLVTEATGQFTEIGTKDGQPVVMVRVDREVLPEGKYKNQPNALQLMRVVAAAKDFVGDAGSSIGFVTSNTYASRAVSTIEAGLDASRDFRVGMYGRETLRATGGPVPAETPINQIPSEMYTMALNLKSLLTALKHQAT